MITEYEVNLLRECTKFYNENIRMNSQRIILEAEKIYLYIGFYRGLHFKFLYLNSESKNRTNVKYSTMKYDVEDEDMKHVMVFESVFDMKFLDAEIMYSDTNFYKLNEYTLEFDTETTTDINSHLNDIIPECFDALQVYINKHK
jgi:hypothetical protein